MTVLSLPNEQTCGREIPAASISRSEFDLAKRATDGSQSPN